MSRGCTSQMARNIFYGGTLFAVLIFDTETRIPTRSNLAELTPAVVRSKHLWETRNCIGCHTLLGDGAYFAPELDNVYARCGPDFIKAWIKAQPTHAPGRRQMPQFNFGEEQLEDLVQFLKWTNGVNTERWPPNIEG